ncbi:hypothetical protein EDB81DRAFT_780206 [Dactylonectria macrodidyma]|uniref:Delta(24)-sterol reductase n=1 Tax=Dactylonectria macrodidyma TaxID=307937 RepID=A0A9P9JJQ7_9HYPO|nr:hypothetical protein EDB81DRAFT_780206 [Dactylonectria macrodidyma]
MDAHNETVIAISERVKHFHARQQPFRMYHGSTNSTRQSDRRIDNTVDTTRLNHVLKVDTASKSIFVEPNVPMDALVEATLKHGLIPLVVMEFPGITVGGGFSGTSGESSSFRYGAFDTTIRSIEIVLADGTITTASKTEKSDLFWGAASAFGTLGVVTLLEVELRDAKKYVELTYRLSTSPSEAAKDIQEQSGKDGVDFIDGIVYSMDSTVICVGRLVDELQNGAKPRHFTRRQDPWFYLHVEKVQRDLKKDRSKTITDYIPIVDYLFRYDRAGFWVAKYAFKYFLTPFNRVTRYILDPLLRTRVMYSAGHKSGIFEYYMVQDVGVPYDSVDEFQTWLHEQHNTYPLWLCPLRLQRDTPDSGHGLHSEFSKPGTPDLLNFGIWGPIPGNRRDAIESNRALEQKVGACGGKKWLYAQAYYTEEEFWRHYDRKSYDALRAKYSAGYLLSVYDKVKVDTETIGEAAMSSTVRTHWPTQGLKGVYKALAGGDYLLQKKSGNTASKSSRE